MAGSQVVVVQPEVSICTRGRLNHFVISGARSGSETTGAVFYAEKSLLVIARSQHEHEEELRKDRDARNAELSAAAEDPVGRPGPFLSL
jgi:hypothetical protein